MKLKKILVPLDGSRLAEGALGAAADLAKDNPGATLMLLRAAEGTLIPGLDPTEAQVTAVREAETYLENVATRLRAEGVKGVKTSVWYGAPAPSIVEATRIAGADLIVMSTHGRSGLGRLILGSVAESVLRATTTPILLLRDGAAPVEKPPGEALARTTTEAGRV